jgi:hypothetical protein
LEWRREKKIGKVKGNDTESSGTKDAGVRHALRWGGVGFNPPTPTRTNTFSWGRYCCVPTLVLALEHDQCKAQSGSSPMKKVRVSNVILRPLRHTPFISLLKSLSFLNFFFHIKLTELAFCNEITAPSICVSYSLQALKPVRAGQRVALKLQDTKECWTWP